MLLLLPLILSPAVAGEAARPVSFFGLKVWATVFRSFTGVRYRVEGQSRPDRHTAYIYVSNHTSFLDVPALPLFIPGQFRPLGKKELLKIPVLGWIVGTVCVIVDRSDANSRNRSIVALKQLIKRGVSVFIFPEGSMNRSEAALRPFYDGAFRIAVETQTPVLPMVIVNAGNLFRPGTAYVKPGVVKVMFGEPVAVSKLTIKDVPQLKQQIYQSMETLLSEA
jgi:1-acyl-sn-glycerol-3-phosphate acyltransferase